LTRSRSWTPSIRGIFTSLKPQSLDAVDNPSGAPGGIVDLAMDGIGARKTSRDGQMMSSLYQAPEEAPAPAEAAAAAAAPGAARAEQLKKVADKKSASVDISGWGGAKPMKGFTAPKANLGALSGLGGGSSSGGSAATAAGAAAGGGKASAFGLSGPNTGTAFAKGLPEGGDAQRLSGAKAGSFGALQSAANASIAAANQPSYDASRAMGGTSFDGGAARAGGGGGAASPGGAGGLFGSLDAAPKNLKANDPKLNDIKITPPPANLTPPPKDEAAEMRKMIMMMLINGLIGGLMKMIMPF
jgi:hypothetical protein